MSALPLIPLFLSARRGSGKVPECVRGQSAAHQRGAVAQDRDQRFSCVLGMLNCLEVKVLYPT